MTHDTGISVSFNPTDSLFLNLQSALAQWKKNGVEPDIVGAFSSGQRAALFIAAGEEKLLRSPLVSFFSLEEALQKWVLIQRGMSFVIGSSDGGEKL